MRSISLALTLALIAARADVTVRYSMTIEPGAALPPQAAEQMKAQMKDLAVGSTLQIKGNRARSAGMGGCTSITDFDGLTVTLLDDKTKRYATASQKQFLQAMKEMVPKNNPETEKLIESLKIDSTARRTGRTREIRGVQTLETEFTLMMNFPGLPTGMKTVMSLWAAGPAEAARHPALAEIAAYSQRAWEGTDMTASMKTMMEGMPGAGPAMSKLVESLKDTGVLMEMNATMSMPGLAEMLRKVKPEAAAGLPATADDVMMTMAQKLDELSGAELAESLFTVPRDYAAVDLKELIVMFLPGRPPAGR